VGDRRIAHLFHVVVSQFNEFYEKVRGLIHSRELCMKYKHELSEIWRIKIGDVDLAVAIEVVWCNYDVKGGLFE
jgi:hypothetical protein